MNEKLLQFLWQFKLIPFNHLTSETGDKIEIIDPGELNINSGPDFFNAKIKIDHTLWVGNIEMHLKSSLWKVHQHHLDKAYNNVILHVVLENDAPSYNQASRPIPTATLKIPDLIKNNLTQLHKNTSWLKCSHSIQKVDPFFIHQNLEALAVERLAYKKNMVENLLKKNNNNWEQTCYSLLARNFGFNINAEPFMLLAQKAPHKILMQYSNQPEMMEALLYGSAGFLDELINEDKIYEKQSQDFRHLQNKHSIIPLEKHIWKFAKTRPSNFPTVRISQFSQLYFKHKNLFALILECQNIQEIFALFEISASAYWDTHYRFYVSSKKSTKKLGDMAIKGIIINSVIPLLFSYGKLRGKSSLCERALLLLENLNSEKNSIVEAWEKFDIHTRNAKESQAVLHLRTMYCNQKKCLQCSIGLQVLTKKLN